MWRGGRGGVFKEVPHFAAMSGGVIDLALKRLGRGESNGAAGGLQFQQGAASSIQKQKLRDIARWTRLEKSFPTLVAVFKTAQYSHSNVPKTNPAVWAGKSSAGEKDR